VGCLGRDMGPGCRNWRMDRLEEEEVMEHQVNALEVTLICVLPFLAMVGLFALAWRVGRRK
jgi:hypothetical protein